MSLMSSRLWCLYIVRCVDDSLYVGITKDVGRRISEHNHDDQLAAKYTRGRRPVKVVYQESCASRSEAARRELAIKKFSKVKKETLIRVYTHRG